MKIEETFTNRLITLTLSEEEFVVLAGVGRAIGGAPAGPRGLFSNTPGSIESKSIEFGLHDKAVQFSRKIEGSISLKI